MIIENYIVRYRGLTVSQIIWNRWQKPMPGLLEKIYEVNQGIASFGAHLPVGTIVQIPIEPSENQQTVEIKQPNSMWT